MATDNNCPQDPSIPSVDNTALECSELFLTNCVLTVEAYPFLGIVKGRTLTKALSKINQKFVSMNSTVSTLETGLAALQPVYTKYSGFYGQTGTAAPTVTEKENTITTAPTITRTDVGDYLLTSVAGFPAGRTAVRAPEDIVTYTAGVETSRTVFSAERLTDDTIRLTSGTVVPGGAITLADDLLDADNSFLEIIIYNS